MEIVVKDCICGHGKSQGMVKYVKDNMHKEKFLYITPYLEQCHTLAGTTPVSVDDERPVSDAKGIVYTETEYNFGVARFKHPDHRNSAGTKQQSLKNLLDKGENVISTHNLLLNMKLDTLSNASDYVLCIDEALDVYDNCSIISKNGVKKLLRLCILNLEEDGITLSFSRDNFGKSSLLLEGEDAVADTLYEELAVLCDNKQLLLVNGCVLLWEFSSEILKKFKKVFILSYLFEGREMSVYLKKHGLKYTVVREGKGGADVKHLVDVLEDDKLNSVGREYFDLSSASVRINKKPRSVPERENFDTLESYTKALNRYNNYTKGVTQRDVSAQLRNDTLRKNLHTVFTTRWKAKSSDRLFTCLSENMKLIAGKNYKNNWLGYSTRATNLYRECHHVAFLMNIFMKPTIKEACDSTSFEVDEDLVALSHLVQFVFRSALRSGESIKVYIPSSRMRGLFYDYLNGDYD